METYSMLMSVYHKEKPDYLAECIQSVLDQTVQTNDFVIVCDGPLTPELDRVLEHYSEEYPDIFNIVRLSENVGIGAAANIGLQHCKNDLVAKMDSDDIAVADRCESQLREFQKSPELQVLGGYIEEFSEDPNVPFSLRVVPETNEEIRTFARRRQPFNNQTVMYRRSAVQKVGGYRDFRRCEDYDLYLRMLLAGCYAGNLRQVMTKVRVNQGALNRRASWDTLKGCARSRWYAFRVGYSSLLDVFICVAGEIVITLSPTKVQKFIYNRFLRKKV